MDDITAPQDRERVQKVDVEQPPSSSTQLPSTQPATQLQNKRRKKKKHHLKYEYWYDFVADFVFCPCCFCCARSVRECCTLIPVLFLLLPFLVPAWCIVWLVCILPITLYYYAIQKCFYLDEGNNNPQEFVEFLKTLSKFRRERHVDRLFCCIRREPQTLDVVGDNDDAV